MHQFIKLVLVSIFLFFNFSCSNSDQESQENPSEVPSSKPTSPKGHQDFSEYPYSVERDLRVPLEYTFEELLRQAQKIGLTYKVGNESTKEAQMDLEFIERILHYKALFDEDQNEVIATIIVNVIEFYRSIKKNNDKSGEVIRLLLSESAIQSQDELFKFISHFYLSEIFYEKMIYSATQIGLIQKNTDDFFKSLSESEREYFSNDFLSQIQVIRQSQVFSLEETRGLALLIASFNVNKLKEGKEDRSFRLSLDEWDPQGSSNIYLHKNLAKFEILERILDKVK